jgi:inner membrane transporter RhtA
MSAEPAAAAVSGLLVLGQKLHLRELAALALVSVASAGITLARRDDKAPLQPLE